MAIITSAITTLTDLNDAIISGTQPVNPTAGTLWIDSSKSPAVLKIYKNGAWVTQDLDLNSLDPNMAESIRNVVATIGNMSNDNLLDFQERQQIKDDLTEILGKVLLDTETVLPTVAQLEVLAKGSFYSTRRNALNAGIETSNSIYVDVATQYQNLKTYLESLTPIKPWNVAVADKDKNVTVIKNTFRDKWLQYYLATEKLSLATTEKIKEVQDNLDGRIEEVSLRDKTEILSGNPVFTDKSDDAVVHVEVDGKSEQAEILLDNLFTKQEVVGTSYATSTGVIILLEKNHQYYIRRTFIGTGTSGSFGSVRSNGTGGTYNFIGNSILGDGSAVTTFTYESENREVMYYGYSTAIDGVLSNTIKDTFIIDLTKHFGAGNEPTKEEMDSITSKTGWFSGVREIKDITISKKTAPSPDYPITINSLGWESIFDPNQPIYTNGKNSGLVSWKLELKPFRQYTLETNIPMRNGQYDIFFHLYGEVPSSITNGVAINEPRTLTTDATGFVEVTTRLKTTFPFVDGLISGVYEAKLISKGFDIVSSVGKENLLPTSASYSLAHNNGGGIDKTTFDSITGIGKLTLGAGRGLSTYNSTGFDRSSLVEGKTYTFSIDVKSDIDRNVYLDWRRGATAQQIKANEWVRISYSREFKSADGSYLWGLASSTTINQETNIYYRNPKAEEGVTEKTEWTPYLKSIEYNVATNKTYKTNISLSEPLRSVGDVKDRLFLDTDGLWKVERNVREIVLKGSEDWLDYSKSRYNPYGKSAFRLVEGLPKNRSIFNNNSHFNQGKDLATMNEIGNTTGATNYSEPTWNHMNLYIITDSLVASTTSEFRNFILREFTSNKPVVHQYALATPTIETLSAEQQTKLNNIQSFKGSNYVYTLANVVPNLNAVFKSNMWYRMNVLGEKQVSGNRNWVSNGNLAYPLEKSLWSSYYKGTVKETVDISTETPPFKNALHIKQTTNGIAGIIDAVIWEGAEANVLSGQNISMATWIKYQNINTSELVMQVQVTGKKSDGTFVYDYPKVFSYTGTDLTWKRQTGTVKINLPTGAIEITRIVFRLGLAGSGTGEFWATGIQLETGNALGDWSTNPNDTEEELQKTEARLVLTEKEAGLSVKKGDVVREINVSDERIKIASDKIDITGAVTFSSFDTTTKNAIDDKSTKAEAQGYANSAVAPLKNFTDTAFSDGIIQRAEAQAISEHLNTLKKENDDLTNQYNTTYANTNLTGTPKTNLASAKTAYNTAYTNLVNSINTAIAGDKTTSAQKTDVDAKFTAYSTALKLLTQRMNEALTGVSETLANAVAIAKATLAETTAKAYADGKVTAEEQRAIDDANAKLATAKKYAEDQILADKTIKDTRNDNQLPSWYFSNYPMQVVREFKSGTALGVPDETGHGICTSDVPWKDSSGGSVKQEFRVTNKTYKRSGSTTSWTAWQDYDGLAESAQTDATNAKNSASTANQLLADLSNDNILTPVEKKSVKKEWDVIVSEKAKIDTEATEYGIVTEKATYNTQYSNLNTYITPLLANLNANSTIVGTTFRTNFKNYYNARQDVLNAITSKAKVLADSAQGTADTVKGVVSNFDSAIINANPIFLDWTGTIPAGYSSLAGSSMTKVASGNGMGNAVRYTVATAGTNVYLNPNQVTTAPFYEYVAIETTFKLDSGTIDGAGVLFRYNGTGITDHHVNLKSIIPSPTLNKWYTVTKVIRQATQPAGFTGYSVFPMGGWSSFGTPSVKVIQFDSLKTRQATEQEISAYESNIMITDMSSDSKITPVEKVQLKKEWATINAERTSIDSTASTYGITTERTNMTNAYNTLNTVLNGSGGILTNMTTTSSVTGSTFRAQFDDYYDKKAILQRKINETAKTLANNAQNSANATENKINNAVTTIDNTGVTVKDGNFFLEDDISSTKFSIVDLPNYIEDHSFESVDINYGDYTMVGNDMLYYPLHEGTHSFISGLQSIRGSDWWVTGDVVFTNSSYSDVGIRSSIFGRRSARINNTSTMSNFYYEFTKKQTLTLSAFSKRVSTSSVGALKMTVLLVNLSGSGADTVLISKSFNAVKTDNSIQRDSLTFTLPDNYDALSQGLWIRLEGTSADFIYVDGIQLVDGVYPTTYNPEQGMVNLTTGAYTAKMINVNRIQFVSDNVYMSERGGGALDLANGDVSGLNGLYFNDIYDKGGEGLNFLKRGRVEGSVNYEDYDTFGVIDGTFRMNGVTVGDVLWKGSAYMHGSHDFYPSKKLNECPNGWVFVWSGITTAGVEQNLDWNYTYVPKRHADRSGQAVILTVSKDANANNMFNKYLYIYNDHVKGHASNSVAPANTLTLREIIAW